MVKCENCSKEVERRITRPDGMKVCKVCGAKLSYQEYSQFCSAIIDRKN